MRVTIFGASGGTGQQLVEQSLEQGHHVTAFVRNPDKIQIQHPHLTIIKGDVMDAKSVEQGVIEQDAILCTLGVRLGSKEPVCSVGTKHILWAMEKYNVNRFITVTGIDLINFDQFNLFERVFLRLFSLTDQAAIEDKWQQEKIIKNSTVKWTIVRPPWLTNGPKTGKYRHGTQIRATLISRISRADVADFILKQMTDASYVNKEPTILY